MCKYRIMPVRKSEFEVQQKGLFFWRTCQVETGLRIMDHIQTRDAVFGGIEEARDFAISRVESDAIAHQRREQARLRKLSTPIEYA